MCFQPDFPDQEPLAPPPAAPEPVQSLAIPPPTGLPEADIEDVAEQSRARLARRRGVQSLRIDSPSTGTGLSIK